MDGEGGWCMRVRGVGLSGGWWEIKCGIYYITTLASYRLLAGLSRL